MSKMYTENYYKDYPITSIFAGDRSRMYKKYCNNGKHEGIDYGSKNKTLLDIKNLIDGVVLTKYEGGVYGNSIRLIHNTKYINRKGFTFYSQYCHLETTIEIFKNTFCKNGTYLGKMGNTGNSFGIHLHLMMFEDNIKPNEHTGLLNDILDVLNIELSDSVAFWQFGKLFYNPEIIQKYFIKEQK